MIIQFHRIPSLRESLREGEQEGARQSDIAFDGRQSSSLKPARPVFERGEVAQATLDVGAVLFAFLFVSLSALSIVAAIYILLFV